MMSYWEDRTLREKIFLGAAILLIFVVASYEFLWSPLDAALQDEKQQLSANRSLLSLYQKAVALKGHEEIVEPRFEKVSSATIFTVLESSFHQSGLKKFMGNASQGNDGTVAFVLKEIPFDSFLQLSVQLWQLHHIKILSIDAQPGKVQGTANVTVKYGVSV